MLKICIIEDFLYANDTIDTIFYIDNENESFPDCQWTDFAVSVLDMWCSTILQNYKCKEAKFLLNFIDGPFYIDCYKCLNEVHMEFTDNRKQKIIVQKCDISIDDFVNELINAGLKIEKLLKKQNFGKIRYLDDLIEKINLLRIIS